MLILVWAAMTRKSRRPDRWFPLESDQIIEVCLWGNVANLRVISGSRKQWPNSGVSIVFGNGYGGSSRLLLVFGYGK
jgi:hypothetical protein